MISAFQRYGGLGGCVEVLTLIFTQEAGGSVLTAVNDSFASLRAPASIFFSRLVYPRWGTSRSQHQLESYVAHCYHTKLTHPYVIIIFVVWNEKLN